MKFFLTRHCETDCNRQWRLQGHSDTDLNENGWMQAEELAEKLKDLGIKKIVSSDLKRSIQTASILARYLKVPFSNDARLRECAFGMLEGKKRDEVLKLYEPRRVDMEENGLWHGSFRDYDFGEFGGESRDQVLGRQISLLEELYTNETPEPTLLVGHGTSLNTLLTRLNKPHLERGEWQEIDYP